MNHYATETQKRAQKEHLLQAFFNTDIISENVVNYIASRYDCAKCSEVRLSKFQSLYTVSIWDIILEALVNLVWKISIPQQLTTLNRRNGFI